MRYIRIGDWHSFSKKNTTMQSKSFEKAAEIKPDDYEIYSNWGLALFQQEKYGDAVKKFEKAAEIKPNDYEIYYNWGLALSLQEKYGDAVKKFEKAAEIKPNDYDI